ncbi:MAG: hypothetical protein K1X61_07420 [Chitinophagales bacterium]|nr:hypothetical protein [Chitinophagales bacterium]
MTFEFRAHKPGAYQWFALALLTIILLNAWLLQSLHSILLDWNSLIQQSVILVVPWILFLFLPSVISGMYIYYSLAANYRFTMTDSAFSIQQLNSKRETKGAVKSFGWTELKEFRFSDFEDNEYFTLVFTDTKNNLILHRESGAFEEFFEELKKYMN